MMAAVDQQGGPPLTTAALASRFGGGLVARLAASKALQSRQASTEPSAAVISREASEPTQDAASPCPDSDTELGPAAAADDDALLLSGLLNAAGAAGHAVHGLLSRLRPDAVAAPVGEANASGRSSPDEGSPRYHSEFSELLQTANASAASLANHVGVGAVGSGSTGAMHRHDGSQPAPPAGEDQPAAATEHSGQQLCSFKDAADDTVLTGSPQTSAAGSPEAGSPQTGLPAAEPVPVWPVAETFPAAQAPASSAVPHIAANSFGAPVSQQPHRRPATAYRSRVPKPPPKAAIPQQQWNFTAIAQGTASIPSKTPAPQHRPAPAAGSSGRPAFYTRAASPQPRSPAAPPAAAVATAAGQRPLDSTAGEARESRQQRLERLAQPKRSVAPVRRQSSTAVPAAANRAGRLPFKPSVAAASEHASAATERGGIAAWRPSQSGQLAASGSGTAAKGPHAAPDALPVGRPADRAPAVQLNGRSDLCWPAALGRQLEGAELQRATGAYSQERFQAHLARLQEALAPHQERRQQEVEAASAGVDELVARVRQLGTGTPSAATATCSAAEGMAPLGHAAEEAAPLLPSSQTEMPAPADGGLASAERPSAADMEGIAPPEQLPHSPTERLLVCQQRLQQRPLTAPGLGSCSPGLDGSLGRPATGSPGKVKSLMQVKAEQDSVLQQLRERPRTFRASPLPLSTMEPRYQRQEEQRDARRQAAHEQRRQQLLEQQRPFGFEERAAERARRRQLLHGGGHASGSPLAAATCARPGTPPFHAHPVPVATTEARYALLAAELQLHPRPWPASSTVATAARPASGSPASPNRRPATAAARLLPASGAGRRSEAQREAAADAVCSVVVGSGKGDGGAQPHVLAAEQAGQASAGSQPCTAINPEQNARCSVAAVQPVREARDEAQTAKAAAAEPQHSEQFEAEAADVRRSEPEQLSTEQPPLAHAPIEEGRSSLAPAAQLPVEGAQPDAAGGSRAAEQMSANAGEDSRGSSQQLQLFGERAQPAVTEAADRGGEVRAAEGCCPVVQRLGSRGGSINRELASPEAGIGVPVAFSSVVAVGAELLAARSLRAGSASWQSAAGQVAVVAASEERRDTPPQHIAARHQQVAAAARREVEAALARRGLRLEGL